MVEIKNTMTTISINRETRKDLAALASKDQTFDDILKLLLHKWNETK